MALAFDLDHTVCWLFELNWNMSLNLQCKVDQTTNQKDYRWVINSSKDKRLKDVTIKYCLIKLSATDKKLLSGTSTSEYKVN